MILVIAMFIIVGVYVGYHASQQSGEVEEHGITVELEILNEKSGLTWSQQNQELKTKTL